jgi:hypothetical protein
MENKEFDAQGFMDALQGENGAKILKDIVSFLQVLMGYIQQLFSTLVVEPKYNDSGFVSDYENVLNS